MPLDSKIKYLDEKIHSSRDNEILNALETFVDREKTALDIGCGDGRFTEKISKKFEMEIHGIDIYRAKNIRVPVSIFDGKRIPFKDNSFDYVFFMDVLHHTEDIGTILNESFRVAKKSVIIKDHYCENLFERSVLKLIDFAGNLTPGVPVPFNFKSSKEWKELLKNKKVKQLTWQSPVFSSAYINQIMFKVSV